MADSFDTLLKRFAPLPPGFSLRREGRRLLHEVAVDKRGTESTFRNTNRRVCFVLSDAVVLAKEEKGLLVLKDFIVCDARGDRCPRTCTARRYVTCLPTGCSSPLTARCSSALRCAREYALIAQISAPAKSYVLILPSIEAKLVFLSRLGDAFAHVVHAKPPGWQHERIRGTLLAAAVEGNLATCEALALLTVTGREDLAAEPRWSSSARAVASALDAATSR